jgi:hypothetical protein
MAPNRGSIDQVFEFVEVCETLNSVEECMNTIEPIVADLGFSSFVLTGLPLLNRPPGAPCSSRLLAQRLDGALLITELLRG